MVELTPDQRLLREMEAAVKEFDAGRLVFRGLLDRLETCVDYLSDEDLPWKESFQSHWGRMEDAYAYAVFKGRKTIPESSMPSVELALKEVRRLIGEKTAMRM